MTPKKQTTQQPTQADCGYIKNGVIYSSYDGRKIGRIKYHYQPANQTRK